MNNPAVDIIVPVWNRPVETRNCLVTLIEHSPHARFILVDNGSDRETERLLEEFAEILDHRALLLRNNVNQGYVKAVNKGLARAEAPYIAIVRNTSLVTANWLEPMLDLVQKRGEAGVVVPRLVLGTPQKSQKRSADISPIEADHGSLAAMLLNKKAYDAIGGIDEDMDGGIWCLKDFSRRSYRAGFLTFRTGEGSVYYEEDVPLGSAERRETAVQRSIGRYRQMWGVENSFCVYMPKGADLNILRQKLEVLHEGARQGHAFTVLTHGKLQKELLQANCHRLHEHILFFRLPSIFEARALRRILAYEHKKTPGVTMVTGIDGMAFPGAPECIRFAELERIIAQTRSEKYGG
jgi:glycosyltransferase involved in cell wall biosynthesis